MAHTNCAFENDHSDLTDEEALSSLEDGVCPLCAHDFYGSEGETVCIECEHSFDNQSDGDEVLIKVIPMESRQ